MRQTIFALLLLFASVALYAQPKQNSAYSRNGIGDILPQYFANQAGWAGQTAAFHDPYHLNLANPASFAFLRSTAFETGLYTKYSHYTSATSTLDNWSGNLAYMALGFTLNSPINEALDKVKSPWRYGMGVSLTPYSLVGYKLISTDFTDDLGKITNTFEGNGGTYQLSWSSAAKYKNTSAGLSLGWMFGKAKYTSSTDFNSSFTYSFLNNTSKALKINGFVYNFGVQHDIVLKRFENDKSTPLKWITLGFTASGNHKLKVTNEELFVRSRNTRPDGQYINPDTLVNFTGDNALKQSITLPASFTLGIQYAHANKFKAGAQLGFDLGSSYKNEANPETQRNAVTVSGGIEYTPDFASYNHYGKRIRYRAGLFFHQDPRIINGKGLDNAGITLGFGLPITLPRQQTSFVNMAIELGQIGAGTTIEERYARLTVGFTLNDNTWFYKRRFE